jgi:hypothetical protein
VRRSDLSGDFLVQKTAERCQDFSVTSLPVHDATAISGGPEIWNLKEVKD